MKLSVIIPTYNRYQTLNYLIEQLDKLGNRIEEIIVIDSTDKDNRKTIYPAARLRYFTTHHKNGLFQRYTGYLMAQSEWLLFLDNDMELISNEFLSLIEQLENQNDISGIAFKIEDKHSDTALAAIPTSILFKQKSSLKDFINWITGYSKLPPGKLGLCGNRGPQPSNGEVTEWVSGGAFAAKKKFMFNNYNFQLFDLFENKLGMGEDVLFGYTLSKKGKLIYCNESLFYHNDQKDSAYSMDHFSYSKRVIFSRLYLSLEKTRLDNGSFIWSRLFYHWFIFWRISGLILNYFINPTLTKKNLLRGGLQGWRLALSFKFSNSEQKENYWQKEALRDCLIQKN